MSAFSLDDDDPDFWRVATTRRSKHSQASVRRYPPGWTCAPLYLHPYIQGGHGGVWPAAWPVLVFPLHPPPRQGPVTNPHFVLLIPEGLLRTLELVGTRVLPAVMEGVATMGLDTFMSIADVTPGTSAEKLKSLRAALLGAVGLSYVPGLGGDKP